MSALLVHLACQLNVLLFLGQTSASVTKCLGSDGDECLIDVCVYVYRLW